jgi:integrase
LRCDPGGDRLFAQAAQPPAALSTDEAVRFVESVSSRKVRVALTTAYAAGLRASEVTGQKAADIDSGRMVIRVERGKGGKERYVMSSEQALGIRRSYWRFAQARTVFVSGS